MLTRLNSQIAELTELLALEKSGKQDVEDTLANLQASLQASETETLALAALLERGAGASDTANAKVGALTEQLNHKAGQCARHEPGGAAEPQIAALRRRFAAVEAALQASEAKDQSSQAISPISAAASNVALAQRVQELNRYRSDFFGRLREILSDRQNIRIVGDRYRVPVRSAFSRGWQRAG